MCQVVCIDFADEHGKAIPLGELAISEYDADTLAEQFVEFGVNTLDDLTSAYGWDRMMFESYRKADRFLRHYKRLFEALPAMKGAICNSRDLPAVSMYKRNLVQILMGAKTDTYRDYDRGFRPGTLVNMHDRTNFVTVRIKSITPAPEGQWKYEFELP